jgi:hypothetical protein
MVPQEKVRSSPSSRRHEIDEDDSSDSSSTSSCSVESTRRTAPRAKDIGKAPLDSVTQEETVKVTTTTREEATPSPSPPPVEISDTDAPASSLRTATATATSSNVCCSIIAAAVAVADDSSVSDISTGSCAQSSSRSIFQTYWDKSGGEPQRAPSLIRASSFTSASSSSFMASSMSSVPLHVGGSASASSSPRPNFQDPSKLEYEDSLMLAKLEEEATPSATQTQASRRPHQEEQLEEDLGCVRRRSIIGQHGYRSHSEPTLSLRAMACARPTSTAMTTTPTGTAAAAASGSITSLARFFAPFRKTRSASTLHDHPKAASSSLSGGVTAKSCLRRGRFSSSSFSDMTTTTTTSSKSSRSEDLPPLSPVLSDAGSVTFNEDDNRVVVFDAPRELWSPRGWSDYFAC